MQVDCVHVGKISVYGIIAPEWIYTRTCLPYIEQVVNCLLGAYIHSLLLSGIYSSPLSLSLPPFLQEVHGGVT